jgi:hydrogenase/urease accessory protein HupE
VIWIAPLLFLASPKTADAHLVTTGLGPLYDGISHLLLSPDDLLGVLAMALLAGLGGARHGRLSLLTLPPAWMLGGLLGLSAPAELSWPVVNTLSLLVVGALVAIDPKLPAAAVTAIAAALGLVHGFLNGTAMAQAGGGALALVGICSTVFVLVALAAALVVSLRVPWTRIVVRVAGSWIAAIGLLMLGWAIRGTG